MRKSAILLSFGIVLVLGAQSQNRLDEGWKFFKEKSYKRAVLVLSEFLKSRPSSPRIGEAYYLLGESYRRLHNNSLAQKALKKAIDRQKQGIWTLRAKVSLARINRWAKESKKAFFDALKFFEEAYRTNKSLGEELFQLYIDLIGLSPYIAQVQELTQVKRKLPPPASEEEFPDIVSLVERALKVGLTKEQEARILATAGNRVWGEARLKWYKKLYEEYQGVGRWDEYAFRYASHLEGSSSYVEALKVYRKILQTYTPRQSRYVRHSNERIKRITSPALSLYCSNLFAPGENVQVTINWRNLNATELELLRCSVSEDSIKASHTSIDRLANDTADQQVRKWTEELEDEGKHIPRSRMLTLHIKAPGLYLLRAHSKGLDASTTILITDIGVATIWQNERLIAFCTNALTGKPISAATVVSAAEIRKGRQNQSRRAVTKTSAEGVAESVFQIPYGWWLRRGGIFVLSGDKLAYSPTRYHYYRPGGERYLAYFYTDRPVYRPEETVNFKLIVRSLKADEYHNLPDTDVILRIYDSRGSRIYEKTLRTDSFGTANDSLKLPPEPALGLYRIDVRVKPNKWCQLAQYSPFRVEEYRRPEFEVVVKPTKSLVRSGEKVSAIITAKYYFGGPVADAKVEVVIRQRPFYYWYRRYYVYEWYYPVRPVWGGRGHEVKRFNLTTDPDGKAIVTFDTPRDADFIFTIEARVTDKSRREVKGIGDIKVTTQPFYITALPERYIYLPGDTVEIKLVTENANNEPVDVLVNAEVFRLLNTEGKEVAEKTVLTRKVKTGETGKATLSFKAPSEGYFRVVLTALTPSEEKISTTTYIWVTEKASASIGYRASYGINLVVEKETYKPGETAKVLLITSRPAVSVFLFTAGDELMDYQVIPMQGTSKLLSIPITSSHSPNFFINAIGMWDRLVFRQTKEIIVPPEHHFINLKFEVEKDEFKPRESTTIKLRATDQNGKPLLCSLSLAVFDRSVLYIQPDTVPDIRKFFFGTKRYQRLYPYAYNNWRYYRQEPPKVGLKAGAREKQRKEQEPSLAVRRRGLLEERAAADAAAGAPRKLAKAEYAPGPAPGLATAQFVRTDFRATALWRAVILTNKKGEAEIPIKFPDSLTEWSIVSRGVTRQTRIGQASTTVRTTKKIIARLQAPRFFVERDDVVVSVIAHNYYDEPQPALLTLEVKGLDTGEELKRKLTLPPKGQKRLDWQFSVPSIGEAYFKVLLQTPKEADALERTYPILPHGVTKFIAKTGEITQPSQTLSEVIEIPEGANLGATRLRIVATPTVATAMVQALDYLAGYPYGCVEQTLSRFVPTVVTLNTLQKLGINKPDLAEKLPPMISAGLKRLSDFQHSDGGWGWWKHDRSNPWMTAYVVYALTLAQRADVKFDQNILSRGLNALQSLVPEGYGPTTQAFCLYSLSLHRRTNKRFLNRVWEERDKLSPYARACTALTFANLGDLDKARILLRNLENDITYDPETLQARCGRLRGYHWWWQDAVESTSMALRAFLKIDPENKLTRALARWLVLNRRGNRWKSTRDTAFAIYALADFSLKKRELDANYTLTLAVNDRPIQKLHITPDNIFNIKPEFIIDDSQLHTGSNTITISKQGKGSLYYSLYLKYYTKEENVKASGNMLLINRSYYLLKPKPDGGYERLQLKDGDSLRSGERVEVLLKLTAKNDLEYIVLEDMKPSGLEPTEIRSGWIPGASYAHTEFRDEKVAFFFTRLNQGELQLRYTLRAEAPGYFHTMPTSGYAMYIPEIRCTSDEFHFKITP